MGKTKAGSRKSASLFASLIFQTPSLDGHVSSEEKSLLSFRDSVEISATTSLMNLMKGFRDCQALVTAKNH